VAAVHHVTATPQRQENIGVTSKVHIGSNTRKPTSSSSQQTSDYPGTFLFYDQEHFLDVYRRLISEPELLEIPSTMAGRDQRIIREKILDPLSLYPVEEDLEELSNVKEVTQDTMEPAEEPQQDNSYSPERSDTLENDRSWGRGRGGLNRGRKQTTSRGRARNNRSYPTGQQYYETFGGARNKNRNRNNAYQNYETDTYEYSRHNRNNENYAGAFQSVNTHPRKQTSRKAGAVTSAQKTSKNPRWIVAGSQQDQDEAKDTQRHQGSTGPKYVPKGTGSGQKYRPKAQPVS